MRTNGAIGIADSGQLWQQLGSIPVLSISGNKVIPTANTGDGRNISVIERTQFGTSGQFGGEGSVECEAELYNPSTGGGTIFQRCGIILAKNETNWIEVLMAGSNMLVNVNISGVITTVSTSSVIPAMTRTRRLKLNTFFHRSEFGSGLTVTVSSKLFPPYIVDLSSYYSTFSAKEDMRYVGIILGNSRTGYSFKSKNLFE
jgi:hypothetical protein